MSVSYKVSLTTANQEPDVRRFMVDKEVTTSFAHLQEKLFTLFPDLKRSDFTIRWTDADSDEVTVTCDDDLIVAITEMKGPIYKFSIKTTGGSRLTGGIKREERKSALPATVHPVIDTDVAVSLQYCYNYTPV